MQNFETILEKFGGRMAARIRAFDWQNHPLGPLNDWPEGLKTVIQIMLGSKYAMWLGWGPEFYFFFNDAYIPTLGIKDSQALGAPAGELWKEIWPTIGPRVEAVVRTGEATWEDALLLFLERSGFPEETYHTFSYGPAPDGSGGIGGMLCVVTEETERIIGERRLAFLGKLATELTSAKTEEHLFTALTRSVQAEDRDLPYAALYLFDQSQTKAELAWVHTVARGSELAPLTLDLDSSDAFWSAAAQIRTDSENAVRALGSHFQNCPTGHWDKPPREAVFVPIAQQGQTDAAGFLVVGANPYRPLNDSYQRFLSLIAGQVASALSNAKAYETERKRAEALAEIDRAKTTFFNNVSHELRTPLTLMMGPLEDLLNAAPEAAVSSQRELAAVAHRNGLRLLKLVNTLLDFARIEAGRIQATFAPADLSVCTSEIASCFHSAVEKAGLKFSVNCPPLSEPVFIDNELWEKIILNLLSNAFKYTLEGCIEISLREEESSVIVQVKDTGCGIPDEAKPHLFERFYRVEGALGRTHEGTGIGLALVNELVKLHRGTLTFESTLGKGSTFTVTLLKGWAHLPRERLSTRRTMPVLSAPSDFEEAARWTSEAVSPPEMAVSDAEPKLDKGESTPSRPAILLADDNADMRHYITRLLAQEFEVVPARDGQEALETLEQYEPDLILSDVMMPKLDGLGLLKAVRAHPKFHSIPFIMLSARAGEEARVGGVASGADDYLVKPFSARELLARVKTHVQLWRLRKETTEKLRLSEERLREARDTLDATLNAAAIGTWSWDIQRNLLSADDNLFSLFSVNAGEDKSALLDWFLQSIHPEDLPRVQAGLNRTITGESEKFEEDYRVLQKGRPSRWVASRGKVRRSSEGRPELMTGVLIDITERKRAELHLRRQRDILEMIVSGVELTTVMERLTDSVEAFIDRDMVATILLMNGSGDSLRPCAGRRSPAQWTKYIHHVPVAAAAGSCGTAAFRRERVVVSDIATDPLWKDFATEALANGLKACWSTPILSSSGQVLGTFAIYYFEPGTPTGQEIELVDVVTRTASIAIERKRSEEALRESQAKLKDYAENLEDMVKERTSQLQETIAELEAFSYSVSHDLRAPLRAMQGYTTALLKDYQPKLDKTASSYLHRIARNAERLELLVRDILAYSKVAKGEVKLSPVALGPFIENIIALSPHLQPPNATITISDGMPQVYAHEAYLSQVISNLLGNAVKFRHSDRPPTIVISGEKQGGMVVVSVTDNGLGIDPEHFGRIFQIFGRVYPDKKYEGTGIGLAIVKKAVERMGGAVGVKSSLGQGSTFWFQLKTV